MYVIKYELNSTINANSNFKQSTITIYYKLEFPIDCNNRLIAQKYIKL